MTTANVLDVHRIFGGGNNVGPSDAMMSVRYSPDGEWAAAAATSGVVHLFGNKESATFAPAGLADRVATTSMRWAPPLISASEGANPAAHAETYRVCCTLSNGTVAQWLITPRKKYELLSQAHEEGNESMVADYNPTGDRIVSGGSDCVVRLYDASVGSSVTPTSPAYSGVAPMPLIHSFSVGMDHHGQPTLGHNSRIFAVHWIDPFVFVSAGWESSPLLYDTRHGKVAQLVFEGPMVTGDGIDSDGTNTLVTVSERPEKQLQSFDFRTGKLLTSVTVPGTKLIGGRLVRGIAGPMRAWVVGQQENVASCVEVQSGKEVASIKQLAEPLFAVDVRPGHPTTAVMVGSHNCAFRVKVSYD